MTDFEQMGPCEFVVKHRDYKDIPLSTLHSLRDYVILGSSVGHFLAAVLNNDLYGAVDRGDVENLAALPALVRLLVNQCPGPCHALATWSFKKDIDVVSTWCNAMRRRRDSAVGDAP